MGNLIVPPEEELEKIRPKHIDFKVMVELVNESDEVDDIEDVFEEWTGQPMDEVMDEALKSCMSLCTSFNPAAGLRLLMNLPSEDPNEFTEFYGTAFLTGLCRGLESARGIEIPDGWTPKSKDFWDLHGTSVMYMSVQRIIRAAISTESDGEPRKEHPLIVMASIWIDAFVIGARFDARKEVLIN